MTLRETIDEMVRRIVRQFRPEKIILFGSAATGGWTSDSDIDLLVIVRELQNRRALRVAIRQAINGMGVPKDVIVLTADEFETKRRIPGTIAFPADREGEVLYAA